MAATAKVRHVSYTARCTIGVLCIPNAAFAARVSLVLALFYLRRQMYRGAGYLFSALVRVCLSAGTVQLFRVLA